MIPCGILDCGVTSIYEQLNYKIKIEDIIEVLSTEFLKVFKQ